MVKVKPVQNGRTTRMSFSRINEVIDMPNLIEIQKNSYNWFLEEGLREVFHDIAAIEDYTGNLVLEFIDYRLDKNPKYSIKECKERDATYAAPLYVTARLFNKQTGEVKEQEIFMGDFPLMTDSGTFISNGADRAIVSQLVRSPGVFYGSTKDRTGKDVVAVSLDVGQGGESLETIKERALACGAVEAYVVDARNEFADEYCMLALKANAMYEGVYPLVSAISRPLITKHLVRAAHQFGADTIAHGCTGKGNDQVRFEVSIQSIDPTLKAISPIRDLSLTRDVEIAYAKEHQLPIVQTEKSPYSIDQNVWGRAIETGFLEDPWNGPTKDCYAYTDDPAFPPVEDEVIIEFKQGVPVKIDGRDVTPLQAIEEMNRRAGAQGIGRIDLIEDRLVGIKSRELYECPGAVALITAHQELENCCLEREQHRIKRDIDKRWGELVYDAQWFSPAVKSLNAFIEDTQQYVSGEIRMILHGGRAVVTGRRSETSLYDYNLATYDSGDSFDQNASNGFIEIYGLPTRVAAARDVKFGNGIEVPDNTVE